MLYISDTSVSPVRIQYLIIISLRTHGDAELPARRALILPEGFFGYVRRGYRVGIYRLSQAHPIDTLHTAVHQSGLQQFVHDGHDAAGSVHILNMILVRIGGNMTDARNLAREHINIVHRKVRLSLLCHGKQMEHRIRRTSHRNIQRHRVQERLPSRDTARQHALIAIPIILICILHNLLRRIAEQLHTVGMRRHNRPIPRQSQSDSLVQTVHRVCRKHPRTTPAARTSMSLDLSYLLVAHRRVGGFNHRVDQVEVPSVPLPGFHRTSGDEDRRYVEPHRRHQHPRRYLVAIADADHRVRLVRINHIFDAVGDDVARRQRIEHPVVPHRDSVVDGNGIELGREATQLLNLGLDQLSGLVQMRMPGDKLGE